MRKTRSDTEIAQELYEKAQRKFTSLQEKLRLGKTLTENEEKFCKAIKLYGTELNSTQDKQVMNATCTAVYESLNITPRKYRTLADNVKVLMRSMYNDYFKNPVQQLQLM